MIPLSLLDLSPVTEGGLGPGQSLKNSRDLARRAEAWGYRRYWMAEHHNMPGLASAATAVSLAYAAEGTSTIRIGAGGIMLPNHAPLVIAEQFGTLAAIHPGRVDLGLGRAPGTDQHASHALRRGLAGDVDRFPNDVLELIAYFRVAEPGQRVQAQPGAGQDVAPWILGSSTYGAQLAALLGLPFAFASHFAPEMMTEAVAIYRAQFRPSETLDKPYVMLGLSVVAADTDAQAEHVFTSQQLAFVRLRTGNPGLLPAPVDDIRQAVDPALWPLADQVRRRSVVGSLPVVKAGIEDFAARNGADELILTAQIFDHGARLRSFEIAAEAAGLTAPA